MVTNSKRSTKSSESQATNSATLISASTEPMQGVATSIADLSASAKPSRALIARSATGGLLMGLANLVPGISGGTMLLASGVYPNFIQAVADVTTLKFRWRSILPLVVIALSAAMAIGLFAGAVKNLVIDHRGLMYSLFIGLTLGGVPVIKKLIGSLDKKIMIWAFVGFIMMALLAVMQSQGIDRSGTLDKSFVLMFFAGVAGASAMILPGISGGYLLLVLGCYVPILGGIEALKEALIARDFAAAMTPGLQIVLPVALGVVVGVAVVSNVLKWLLKRHEQATLGVLLGLLLGAVVGLWPFQAKVSLTQVHRLKGQQVQVVDHALAYVESGKLVKPKDYPTTATRPTFRQGGISLAVILLGFGVTSLVAKLGASAMMKNSGVDE